MRLDTLLKMAQLDSLSDMMMVKEQRAAMTDPNAPNPSVEAILHAIIPFTFVDHTHADTVVTITNTDNGEERIREIYGDRVLIIPYVMPGFILAKEIQRLTANIDWSQYEGMVLLNHGVFTFANSAKESYENMIKLVNEAEEYLLKKGCSLLSEKNSSDNSSLDKHLTQIATLRQSASQIMGKPLLVKAENNKQMHDFSSISNIDDLATRGPLTPDHIIRTKQKALIVSDDISSNVANFANDYKTYFNQYKFEGLSCLDAAPRWAVWPNVGTLSFGKSTKELNIISDIIYHTAWAIKTAEQLGGWKALPAKDLFEMEYWSLEQAKLKKSSSAPELQGKIAIVTGGASGIGKACVKALASKGAAVIALDINPDISNIFANENIIGLPCDVLDNNAMQHAINHAIKTFGGIDIIISNAGNFPASQTIECMDAKTWEKSLQPQLN